MTIFENVKSVLILVILEYTLRGNMEQRYFVGRISLNPCYTGIYSTSVIVIDDSQVEALS